MPETYEIYLDESGSFEMFEEFQEDGQKKPVRLIGGIVVPQRLHEKTEALRSQLAKEICEKFLRSFRGVTDIHLSDPKNLKPGKTPVQLRGAISRFFKDNMPEALIAFIYDLEELGQETRLPGAQRYRYLLLELLKALVLYHPWFSDSDSFDVKLAHRRVPYPMGYDRKLADQGYLKLKDYAGRTEYTAITVADLKSIMDQLEVSLSFKSERKATYSMKPYASWDNPFMTMADFLCNTVLHVLLRSSEPRALHSELVKTFGPEKILFYCPSDYVFPSNLLASFHQGHLDHFFSEYLRASEARGPGNTFCDQYLLKPAVIKSFKRLRRTKDPDECGRIIALADNFLDNRMFYRLSEINVLIQLVKDTMDEIADGAPDPVWDAMAYRYHDVCLRYCNHTANTIQGVIHRDKGIKLFLRSGQKNFHQIREFHEFINRASVWDANEFAFERAIARLEPVKKKEKNLTEILGSGTNEILGKIYGSIAQNFAFLGRHQEARGYFQKASEHLGHQDTLQTSYRAHLAVDAKDKEAYQQEMCSLFKKDSFPGYFELTGSCLTDLARNSFTLHLVLKGLLAFPSDEPETRKAIALFSERIHPMRIKFEEHPWELIYTVMGRLLKMCDEIPLACQFWKAAAEFATNNEQLTFIMLGHAARVWETLYWMESRNTDKARSLMTVIRGTFQDLKEHTQAVGIFNPHRTADEDGKTRPGWFDKIGHRFLTELDRADGSDEATLKSLSEEFISRFTFNYW